MTHDPRSALKQVLERIAAASQRSGRAPEAVQLVAISKSFPAARVRELLACGQTVYGENRVQEALAKIPEVGPGARWQLVGHLQRNKARHAVGAFELIHGVDSTALASTLDRWAAAAALRQPILIQVNLAAEAAKSGVGEDALWPLIDHVAAQPHLDLRGLMALPPPVAHAEESRPLFARMRALLEESSARLGRRLTDLSMGMSADYEVAVEEGATLVRVGSAIFGAR